MIKVNVEVNNKSWHKKIKNPKKYFSKKLEKISKIIKFFKGKNIKEILVINFDHQDVMRHPLVTKIVEAYQKNHNDNG